MTARPDRRIPLIEAFGPTVQGEGSMCGHQTMFIRLGTCDLACRMCDSKHAVEPVQVKKNATYLTAEEIGSKMIELNKDQTPWVTLSGGNPAIWNLTKLVDMLHAAGMKVAIETQGTFFPEWIHECDLVTVSPKGPGMTDDITNWDFLEAYIDKLLIPRQEGRLLNGSGQPKEGCLKIVIFDEADMEYARTVWALCPSVPLYLSLGNSWIPGDPISGSDHVSALLTRYRELCDVLYKDPVLNKAIFLPQLHALVYGNELGR
jgi:7-carboxy-7-deazaguanine synthase